MKKVMIAAVVAALAGIASAVTDCSECSSSCGDPAKCPFGYRFKVMVRTTGACSAPAVGVCGECSTQTYRKPVIRRFMGLVYGTTATTSTGLCGETGCGCNAWHNNAYVAIYDYDNATPMTLNADKTELLQLNRIGCEQADRNKAEMAFQIGFECDKNVAVMTFAGFGLCVNHDGNRTVGAISGYCAGLLNAGATVRVDACTDKTTCSNYAWRLCCPTDTNAAFESAYTAAYGKWTLVWDSGIASKVGTNLTIGDAPTASTGWGKATAVLLNDAREAEAYKDCDTVCVEK